LTVPRCYQKARTAVEAIQFMEDHLLNFLDPKILHAMRRLLAVEGSQLSQFAG
jgi:HD-GYP domain-containing protein (c-di-GMP phosphodiesterase class II)